MKDKAFNHRGSGIFPDEITSINPEDFEELKPQSHPPEGQYLSSKDFDALIKAFKKSKPATDIFPLI